jgi:hypothetical protein
MAIVYGTRRRRLQRFGQRSKIDLALLFQAVNDLLRPQVESHQRNAAEAGFVGDAPPTRGPYGPLPAVQKHKDVRATLARQIDILIARSGSVPNKLEAALQGIEPDSTQPVVSSAKADGEPF